MITNIHKVSLALGAKWWCSTNFILKPLIANASCEDTVSLLLKENHGFIAWEVDIQEAIMIPFDLFEDLPLNKQ